MDHSELIETQGDYSRKGRGEELAMQTPGWQSMTEKVAALKPKQEAAILELLSNRTVEDAARAVKTSPRTLYRWLEQPEFAAAYRKARLAAFGQVTARLQQACGAAASILMKVMVDPATPASTKVRAAEAVLARATRAIELEDVLARVAVLEQANQQSGNRP